MSVYNTRNNTKRDGKQSVNPVPPKSKPKPGASNAASVSSVTPPSIHSPSSTCDFQVKIDELSSNNKVAPAVTALFVLLNSRINEQDKELIEQSKRISELEKECAKTDQYSRRSTIVVSEVI